MSDVLEHHDPPRGVFQDRVDVVREPHQVVEAGHAERDAVLLADDVELCDQGQHFGLLEPARPLAAGRDDLRETQRVDEVVRAGERDVQTRDVVDVGLVVQVVVIEQPSGVEPDLRQVKRLHLIHQALRRLGPVARGIKAGIAMHGEIDQLIERVGVAGRVRRLRRELRSRGDVVGATSTENEQRNRAQNARVMRRLRHLNMEAADMHSSLLRPPTHRLSCPSAAAVVDAPLRPARDGPHRPPAAMRARACPPSTPQAASTWTPAR